MILFAKLLRESAIFAWGSVVSDKLRTILTLLGITIGIFSIISVFTVVDALEKQIRSSISSLGENVVYIQKWPWEFSRDYPWWKYMNRPVPKPYETEELLRRTPAVETTVFTASTRQTIEFGNKSVERAGVTMASHDYDKVQILEIESGRYFSPAESASGRHVVILGNTVASTLFGASEPLGQTIRVFGRKLQVIGVLAQQGQGAFGNNSDDGILIPLNFAASFLEPGRDRYNPSLIAKARPGIGVEELTDELRGAMRSIRRIKPAAEDNFALNQSSLLSRQFDNVFIVLKLAGWIIGGFSILVGGFGIANIMFVSVKERTTIIGIQKALGAKNWFILLQFLSEAVILSLIGGIIGLLLVFGGTTLASHLFEMDLNLSFSNIMLGINVSVIIGIVAGFIPAYSAAMLDPVEAIRANT
jgi:putative ABC transport system permease protein